MEEAHRYINYAFLASVKNKEMQRKNRTITELFLLISPTFPVPHLFVYFFVSLIQESPSVECPTDVLRFTDPKVGNALRSLDFMADADNMPAAEAKPVAIVISITIKLVGASKPATGPACNRRPAT